MAKLLIMNNDPPIVVIVFNRPDTASRLVSCLAAEKPKTLFVVSDGARQGIPGESDRVDHVRKLFGSLPWKCDVYRDYADANLGCRRRVASGLSWVFANVPSAIVLEDDCIPRANFFPYCREVLQRYEADVRVASVSGTTHEHVRSVGREAYRFSRYPYVWGWATWRRAWAMYDENLAESKTQCDEIIRRTFPRWREQAYWRYIFDKCRDRSIDTWDYIWALSCWNKSAMHVVPTMSLVENIGIGSDSTHTKSLPYYESRLPRKMRYPEDLVPPYEHPADVERNQAADQQVEDTVYSKSLGNRLRWLVNHPVFTRGFK